jgi:hypothetical protein
VLAAAIPPEPEFIQCLLLWSIDVLGPVDIESAGLFGIATAGGKAGLVCTPLIGDDISTIHTTDGNDHVGWVCLILVG